LKKECEEIIGNLYQSHIINKDPKKLKVITHSLLLKSMEPHRKRMYDLIETAAKRKNEKSKWDINPPKKPSPEAIKAAQPKTEEVDYSTFDR
tara:strand:+ start:424 stop:699 length:276 start_codon:yes stop_codon:yes gene_type:complete